MQLTKHTDYAFRVLIYLASRQQAGLITIEALALHLDISRNHLMKVVHKLARAGVLRSVRGQQGGIQLGQPASEISLRSVVELMEQTLEPVNCREIACVLLSGCRLRGLLFGAQEQFLAHLGRQTLADLVQPLPGLAAGQKKDKSQV